ncbi:RdgB/HAM1 family non-canonical purine NTP pyrophosphatase [Mycobacteroides sp. LB1]|uniref:RdgB/HAM1 family non-canonical purine NTP pyrophosphatase n=1 Tax=Mycobacteroides sp. LB1 TaxID=2750814 RepID=UPI0015DF0778|nr:RdgB/HAM1 family non-canonical purine NTP pyrophosphatase [Mycobacteroides sp. LB1]
MKILVASRNSKKLRELERVLTAAGVSGVELVSLADVPAYEEVPETGASFEDNALIKAREGVRHTGLACVADDSGIAVDALNWMPGVLSARWSGRHGDDAANTALLLAQLSEVPDDRRGAAFVSACALVTPEGEEVVVEGRWKGSVARQPAGENGFGYDPIFVPRGGIRTAAEMTPEEKDAVSHRGRALAALLPMLRNFVALGRTAP